MGKSVNKVTVIGTMGRDPELKYMPNGNAVVNISVATDESYNDKQSGQKVERTEWHRITAYGKLAEIVGQYLKKGSRAYFEGKLQTREWEKDGEKRYTTEIICNDMMMLDRAESQGQAPAQGFQQPTQGFQQPTQGFQQPTQNVAPNQPAPPPQGQPMGVSYANQTPQGQASQAPQNNFGSANTDIPF